MCEVEFNEDENVEEGLPQAGRIAVRCGPVGDRLVKLVKDVAFLAMLAKVEALNFIFLAGSQPNHGIDHLQDDERADEGQRERRTGSNQLIDDLVQVSGLQ